MTKIIVTGAESSGKTTVCKGLSNYYNIPFSEEYSRIYLNTLQRDCVFLETKNALLDCQLPLICMISWVIGAHSIFYL